jgi:hypothetical protein
MTRDEILAAVREGHSLRGADLRGAVLRGAVLREADLYKADLRRANLGADLPASDGQTCDLREAVLQTCMGQYGACEGQTWGRPARGRPATGQSCERHTCEGLNFVVRTYSGC